MGYRRLWVARGTDYSKLDCICNFFNTTGSSEFTIDVGKNLISLGSFDVGRFQWMCSVRFPIVNVLLQVALCQCL
jgi:hypothetical protein